MASHRGYRSSRFRWLGVLPVVAGLLLATAPVLADVSPAQAPAEEGWLPKPTITIEDESGLPVTLSDRDVLLIRDVAYSAETGVSPITLADNATATVIVEGTVELNGADAEGRTGATPAIEVPETATLVVYGAHDEELAGTYGAPQDSLIVTGGDPAAGENGQNGKGTAYETAGTDDVVEFKVRSGDGGDGGGGGAAAIGGKDSGANGVRGCVFCDGVYYDWGYSGFYGYGAPGLDADAGGSGGLITTGSGVYIDDFKPRSGEGGGGGAPVAAREWTSSDDVPVLVLSTAGNYDLSVGSDLGYAYGSGGGSGAAARVKADARVVYEVEDLSYDPVSGAEESYTYTGSQIIPDVTFGTDASYSAASDRDGALAPGTAETELSVSTSGGPVYGENIHCPAGTVTFDADGLTPRTDVLDRLLDPNDTDPIIVGSQITWRFPIARATLTSAPIGWSTEEDEARVGEPATLSFDEYSFANGGGDLDKV